VNGFWAELVFQVSRAEVRSGPWAGAATVSRAALALRDLVSVYPCLPGPSRAELPVVPTRMWLFSHRKAEQAAASVNGFFWTKCIYNMEVKVNCLLQPLLSNLAPVKVPVEHRSQSL